MMRPAAPPPRASLLRRLLLAAAGLLLLGALSLIAYVAVFFAPDRSLSELSGRWVQAPARFIDSQGVRVHLVDTGPRSDSTPIVLLPGTESGLLAYGPWMGTLAAERRVIALDLPGLGLSSGMPDDDYRPEMQARFLAGLLTELGVQRCVLVGHDLGGEVAWQTAFAFPELASALVLISARGYPSDPWKRSLDDRLLRIPPAAWIGRIAQPRAVVRRSLVDRVARADGVSDAWVDRYHELALHSGNRRARMLRMAQDPDGGQAERIRTLQLPTLIVWGENDRQIPAQQAYWFQRDIAGSKVEILPEVGHLPVEENPAGSLAALRLFLREH